MTDSETALAKARKALEAAATGEYPGDATAAAAARQADMRRAARMIAAEFIGGGGDDDRGIMDTPADTGADKIAAALLEADANDRESMRGIIVELWNTGALNDVERGALTAAPPKPPPTVFLSGAVRNDPIPPPILWRDTVADADPLADPDSIVAPGQIAVLAGAGAAGKSWLAIRLAVEAARAADADWGYGAACGLRIAPGRVVMVSYEMTPRDIDRAAESMGSEHGIPVLAPQGPLFPLDPRSRAHVPGPSWRGMWKALAQARPALVIVDTGPKAMGGPVDANAPGPVIAFSEAIEAELAEIPGAGALVICHDTKAVRDAASIGEDIGAGAAAGSGQWYDSPRGMIHVSKVRGSDIRILEAVKSSYGRSGWGARLEPLFVNPETGRPGGYRYAGLQLAGRIEAGGMRNARKAAAKEADDEVPSTNGRQAAGNAHMDPANL